LESLYAEGEPGSAVAADIAASIASVTFALGREDIGDEWLARAAKEHEHAGSIGAAATDRRRRAEFLLYRGRLEEAGEELERAVTLAKRATGTNDALVLLKRRPDIVAAQAALERLLARSHHVSDFELLDAWQRGDQRAANELLARHYAALRRHFVTKVPPEDVDDLVQEALLRVLRTTSKHRGASTFRIALFRIASHVVGDYCRRRFFRDSERAVEPLDFNDVEGEA